MRDIYVKTNVSSTYGALAVMTERATPGYHASGKLYGFSVCRVVDVPDTVSDNLAVFTFNSCDVLGHTVFWSQLRPGQIIRGEGLAWDSVGEVVS